MAMFNKIMTSPVYQQSDLGHKSHDRTQEDIEAGVQIVVRTLKDLQCECPYALMEFMGYFSSWKRNDIKKCSKNRKSTPSWLGTFWAKSAFESYFYVCPILSAHACNRANGIP